MVAAKFPREACNAIAKITMVMPKAVTRVVEGTPKISKANKPKKNQTPQNESVVISVIIDSGSSDLRNDFANKSLEHLASQRPTTKPGKLEERADKF